MAETITLTGEQCDQVSEKLCQLQALADLLANAYGPGGDMLAPTLVQRTAEVCSQLARDAHRILMTDEV